MKIKKLNVRVTDLGIACRRSYMIKPMRWECCRFWWGGPLGVPPGPRWSPGPALRVTAAGPGGDQGVRPTICTDHGTFDGEIGGLSDGPGGLNHRGCKSLIHIRLGGFRHSAVWWSSTAAICCDLLRPLFD